MKKRILSLLLCLVMALSLLPTAAFAADGDPTIIDRLEINFTTEHNYPGCLAYELTKELRDCLWYKYVGDGMHTDIAKCSNVYLRSWTGPNRTGTSVQIESDCTDLLDPSLYYYVDFELKAQEGYDFQHTGTAFDTSSLTCVINGDTSVAELSSYYNDAWKIIDVYVPITVDTTSRVRDVKITNTDVNVERGGTTQFTSDVLYYGAGYDAVDWSVEGANDANTTIDSTGRLTIAEGETAEKITVKATAAMDPTKFDTRELSVIDKLYIDYVTLDAMYADIYLGAKRTFTATVEGTDAKDLDWSLTGGSSANTSCTVNGNKFTVNIGKDETASTMQLQVWSVKDPTKSAKVTITVLPLSNIERLEVNFTTDKAVEGTTAYELTKELRDCLWYKYVGDGMHTDIAKCSNVYLRSWTGPNRTGASVQIESGRTDLLDPNLYYYADFEFMAQEGYDFKHTDTTFDTASLTCVINGDASVAELDSYYNKSWKVIDVYVPIRIRPSINNVEITGLKQPVVGETAGENLQNVTIPAASHYTASSIKWWVSNDNSLWNEMPDGSQFETGKYYYYRVILAPEDGYCFPMGTVKPNYFAPYTGTVTATELATRLISVCARAGSPEYGTLDITGKTFQLNTVTFDMNGHGTAPAVQTVVKGNQAAEPAAPTAIGYIFDGWYTNAACTTAFDFSTPITANTTVYAKWTDNRITINSINITVDTPIVGKSAAESVFVPTVTTDPANAVEVNMAWTDWYNNGGSGEFTGIFQANTEYNYEICLMAKEGYRFPSVACDDMALANGAAVKYVDVSSSECAYIGIVMTPTAPAAPAAPTLSIAKADGKIKLSWNAVSGANKYWIYRSTDGTNFKYYDSTTGTSYTNGSVTSGTKYYYKVKAVATINGTDYASAYSAAKSTVPMTTPVIKASLSAGTAKLSWGEVTGATKYWIYRSTDGTNFSYYTSTTNTSYTNSSVTGGNTYYYKIKAVKTINSTDWASDYSAVGTVKVLKAPTLSIAKADGKVKLSWTAVSGATKYWIYRSTDGTNFKYYDTTTNTSYTNSSVTSGTKYYYKVKAVNSADGTSIYSEAKSTVPMTTPTLSATLSSGKIKLSWGSVSGATKYWIYRSTDGTNFKYYDSTTNTSYTNSSVTAGKTYYYKIKAVKTLNGTDWASDYSNVVSKKP